MAPRALLWLSLLALGQVARSAKVEWGPCKTDEFNTTTAVQCGAVRVPLDYTSPDSNRTLDLELVKIPASVQPSRGSIQLNFGGPGAPTRATAVAIGPLLQVLSGGVYDLVGFDPRGTGTTIPFVCTPDPFIIGEILGQVISSLDSDTAARRLWERSRVNANICQQSGNGNEMGELIGTAFVARDMVSVAEALEEDGLVRYWGFSYGTTLGATLAAMFPDKIDKLLIDGVQNPHEYYHAHADYEEWTDSDAILTYFFTSCLTAAPGRCALAALNKTAAALESDTWTFIESLRSAPIAAGTALIDMGIFKSYILGQLKFVAGWATLSSRLAQLLYGAPADKVRTLEAILREAAANQEIGAPSFEIVSSLWGIHCGDRTVRLGSFEAQEADGAFKRLYATSRLVGDVVTQITAQCAQWPWRARETYAGDFHVKTRRPILVASTVRDSHTPLRSAWNVSAGFEGSGLLVVNGTGHATLNAPSICGYRATVAYWINGTLPEPGAVCEAPHPFDDYTWANVLAEATGQNVTTAEKRALHRRWWR